MAAAIQFKKAVKFESKGRVALVGPAGSGKSFTALMIARMLVGPEGKIAAVDTEHGSLSKYAHTMKCGGPGVCEDASHHDFDVVELSDYSPEVFKATLRAAEQAGYDAFVTDSLSHFWMGKNAEAERVRIQREADLAIQRAKDAELAVERERAAASERERLAQQRAEAERQAAAERERLAALKAEEDRKAAVTAERERLEAAQRAEQEAAAARERNKTHKATINRGIRESLVATAHLTENDAETVIRAIAKGLIPNVAITY